jgi:hypothetical protein
LVHFIRTDEVKDIPICHFVFFKKSLRPEDRNTLQRNMRDFGRTIDALHSPETAVMAAILMALVIQG